MSKTAIYEAGTAFSRIPLPPASASTFHSDHITLDRAVAVAEAESIVKDALIRAYLALVPKRTIEEEEAEEGEWKSIVSKPHVRQALRRMAAEARRQYYAGETEEGGFGLE
jgi:hypothetical protein